MKIKDKTTLIQRLARGHSAAIHEDGTWSERYGHLSDDYIYLNPPTEICGRLPGQKYWRIRISKIESGDMTPPGWD